MLCVERERERYRSYDSVQLCRILIIFISRTKVKNIRVRNKLIITSIIAIN